MTPLWLDRATCLDIDPPDQLGALAGRDRSVVLKIASCDEASLRESIERLSSALADHSVFRSGPEMLTVLRVIARAEIERHRVRIVEAVAAYRGTCAVLIQQYEDSTLDPAWDTHEHGAECRFKHRETSQLVEAPLNARARVDPFFFELFVKSTPAWRDIAELLISDFHDAARMLEVIGEQAHSPPAATR